MRILSLPLVFSSCYLLARAGKLTHGQNCSVLHDRLAAGTLQFYSDCDAQTYCSGQGFCELKGCRTDKYPFGYAQGAKLPRLCPVGQFCPDEGDACQPLLPLGSPCQLNRDDQCIPPPNWAALADASHYGVNTNGAVCLNDFCMWANVTLGQACEIENTAYIVYTKSSEFVNVVSRDNCLVGSYCDGNQLICMQTKSLGVSCSADKECASFNCDASGTCVRSSAIPNEFDVWIYVVAGVGIVGVMFGTLFGMFWLHGRHRDAEREKRVQYWREQNEFRQSIHRMKETARQSIASLPGEGEISAARSRVHSWAGSEDSSRPILQRSNRPSGLRNTIIDVQDE